MARNSVFGGLMTAIVAAGAVVGLAYLFKDEIRETQKYKDLNAKYDVDTKLKNAQAKANTTAQDFKAKAKKTWSDIKKAEDDIIDDGEIIIDGESSEERDYVTINPEEAAEDISEKAEEIKDAVKEAAEDISDSLATE